MSEQRHERVRRKMHILVEGEDIPPPVKSFKVIIGILILISVTLIPVVMKITVKLLTHKYE